jgi:hypothetical protein
MEGIHEHVRIVELAQQWANAPDPPSSYRSSGPTSS